MIAPSDRFATSSRSAEHEFQSNRIDPPTGKARTLA
jgi:hypothetical protein